MTALLQDSDDLIAVGDATVARTYHSFAEEYRSLRSSAAVFDHAGVGLIACAGEAGDRVALLVSRDIEFLTSEQCTTAALLAATGEVIDILTVYRLDDGLLLETSVGRRHAVLDSIHRAIGTEGVTDLSQTYASIGIEGPYSWGVVGRVIGHEYSAIPYESVVEITWAGSPVLMARTGFTGEYGYKWIGNREAITDLLASLLAQAGPAGLAALELCMLEVRQPLFFAETRTGSDVRQRGWNWVVDSNKEDFQGRAALLAGERPRYGTIGFGGTFDVVPVHGEPVRLGGVAIGQVIQAIAHPDTNSVVGLLEVEVDLLASGLEFEVGDGVSDAVVTTLSPPYRVPTSWSVPIL
jgi:glycine cleavage system aminomethyltransferase T